MPQSTIKCVKLRGHQGPVLCLDHSSSISLESETPPSPVAACLLSGSEDHTARLWDLRANLRASLCIKTHGEVLSVVFGPKWQSSDPNTPSSFSREYSVYLSVENHVYGYDLRKASSPIIQDRSIDLSPILESQDEVNQIALSPLRRSRPLHMAAADDAGTVRVTNCLEQGISTPHKRILQHAKDAMVTSVVFRPRCSKNLELASGGTDCTVVLWDAQKPRRPLSTQRITNTAAGANQVCNPPMVHSLAWSPSGRLLAAGLGDGSLCVMSVENRSLVQAARVEEAHCGSVASVVFTQWSCSSQHVAANDRLVVTTGNDCTVAVWDLGVSLCGDGAINPNALLQMEGGDESIDAAMQDMNITEQPKTLFAWNHGEKPNWMISSCRDPVFPSSLFVADTTTVITAYTLPIR